MAKRVGGVRSSSSARWSTKLSPAQRRRLNRKSRRNSAPTEKAAAAKAKTRSGKQEHSGQKSRSTSKARSTSRVSKARPVSTKSRPAAKTAKPRSTRNEVVAKAKAGKKGRKVTLNPYMRFGDGEGGLRLARKRKAASVAGYKRQERLWMERGIRRLEGKPAGPNPKTGRKAKAMLTEAEKKYLVARNDMRRFRKKAKVAKKPVRIPQQRSWNNNFGRGIR